MLQYLTGKYCLEYYQTKKITDKDIFYSNTILIDSVENKEKLETPVGTLEIINLNDLSNCPTSYLLTLNGKQKFLKPIILMNFHLPLINLEYYYHFGLKVCLNLKKSMLKGAVEKIAQV